jgi:hypothetical protein
MLRPDQTPGPLQVYVSPIAHMLMPSTLTEDRGWLCSCGASRGEEPENGEHRPWLHLSGRHRLRGRPGPATPPEWRACYDDCREIEIMQAAA